jgi:hypothetical protein
MLTHGGSVATVSGCAAISTKGTKAPAGGGFRILGILELFVENDSLQLIRQFTNLRGVVGFLQALEDDGEGLVGGVDRRIPHCRPHHTRKRVVGAQGLEPRTPSV